MLRDIYKSILILAQPKLYGVILRAFLVTLGLLIGAFFLLIWVLPNSIYLPFLGAIDVTKFINLSVGLGFFLIMPILMLPVASLVVGFFLDELCDTIESRHYAPHIGRALGFWTSIYEAFSFLMIFILVNMLSLIVYLFATVFAPIVFILVNGALLGREYATLVVLRHQNRSEARAYRRAHRFAIWALGSFWSLLIFLPFVGFLVPIFAVAAFTHQYHRKAGR